jgi:hypothetical protein
MPISDADAEEIYRSYEMCRAIARAGTNMIEELTGGNLFGPPLCFPQLEKFRLAIQAAYKQFVAVPDTPPPPSHLSVVN